MRFFSSYRSLGALLLLALPCLANTCGHCDECAPRCQPALSGRVGLPLAAQDWLPQLPDSVRFINSNGYRVTLWRDDALVASDSVRQDAVAGTDAGNDYALFDPQGPVTCGPYFQTERRRLRYSSRRLPLELAYALVPDFSGTYPPPSASLPLGQAITQAQAALLPAVMLVSFNGHRIGRFPVVPLPLPAPFQEVSYHDSVVVAGHRFRGVYVVQWPVYDSSIAVRLRTLYFVPGQGVVGFVYTNQEEWARYE